MSNRTKARPAKAISGTVVTDPYDFEPVELVPSGEEVEQVHLFTLDGVQYFIPRRVQFNVTLRAMEMFRTQGEVAAGAYILEALLGEDGYQALINYDELERDQFERITEIAQRIVLGDREKGKAR